MLLQITSVCSLSSFPPSLLFSPGLIYGNDTVIGDPLYTVPFLPDQTSLCFEVHGQTNTYINLISDVCTNVNALYSAMQVPDNGNIISRVTARAVGNSGKCYNINVTLAGCAAWVDGVPVSPSFMEDGIRVRRFADKRVRINVPNCEIKNLVMMVTCQDDPQPMIRFDVARGLNLRPTSHGLLGIHHTLYMLDKDWSCMFGLLYIFLIIIIYVGIGSAAAGAVMVTPHSRKYFNNSLFCLRNYYLKIIFYFITEEFERWTNRKINEYMNVGTN